MNILMKMKNKIKKLRFSLSKKLSPLSSKLPCSRFNLCPSSKSKLLTSRCSLSVRWCARPFWPHHHGTLVPSVGGGSPLFSFTGGCCCVQISSVGFRFRGGTCPSFQIRYVLGLQKGGGFILGLIWFSSCKSGGCLYRSLWRPMVGGCLFQAYVAGLGCRAVWFAGSWVPVRVQICVFRSLAGYGSKGV